MKLIYLTSENTEQLKIINRVTQRRQKKCQIELSALTMNSLNM
jgi:hypothetical protein